MGQEQGSSEARATESREPEQIREEIDDARQELGGTVEAPAAKTDVKARAGEWAGRKVRTVSEAGERLIGRLRGATPESAGDAASQAGEAARRRPALLAAIAAIAALVVGILAVTIGRRRGGR